VPGKHPDWIKIRVNPYAGALVDKILQKNKINTVCREASCPNIWECFQERTATFLILGKQCTRSCSFCAVGKSPAERVDPGEAERVALAARQLKLKHVVVTSVTRDDLPDGGAGLFALTINKLKQYLPGSTVEVLVPDFNGSSSALQKVLDAGPDILNHNVETVPDLYPSVRPQADYWRSIRLLQKAKEYKQHVRTKSGLMVGLGEKVEEVVRVGKDLLQANCDAVTVGQYLSPSSQHHPVLKYYTPAEFENLEKTLCDLGFFHVKVGPLVRSSYRAYDLVISKGDCP